MISGEINFSIIDDEADQASPNAKAQNKDISATYKALAEA
jgi:hypothetical protein